MKIIDPLLITFYLTYFIHYVSAYLPSDEYRDLTLIEDNFSSVQFFSYFRLKLLYYKNDPSLYIKSCKENDVFGYFRFGDISRFFDYDNFGSIGINFNVVVLKNTFSPNVGDSLQFFINDQLIKNVRLDNFTLNNNEKYPVETVICDKNVLMFNISLIYTNKKDSIYPPIKMKIHTNYNPLSNIDWGISNFQLMKINCPAKCSICNDIICLGCSGPNTKFKPNICQCYPDGDFVDYSDVDKPINCRPKYINTLIENFAEPFINTNWFWNGYSISPFYFKNMCPGTNLTLFGGYRTFGDSDNLMKLIKFNDKSIVSQFQTGNNNYEYIRIANYKIEFTVAFFNWDRENTEVVLSFTPTSKSLPLDLLIDDNTVYPCDGKENTNYYRNFFDYNGLSDNTKYANITFTMSATASRTNNNFGLIDFKFSISPCFKTCLLCASPAADSCQSCLDPNAQLSNGQCICIEGYERDQYNPNYPCVKIFEKKIIENGVVSLTDIGYGDIFSNNMRMNSRFCNNTRTLVGGYIMRNLNGNHIIDVITSDVGIIFYMKKISMELITEEDFTLIYPFVFYYNKNKQILMKEFNINKIKYLKFTDELSFLTLNCFDSQLPSRAKYKNYKVEFFIQDKNLMTDISIVNNYNIFWGIFKFKVQYFTCHSNCNACSGYGKELCTECKPGMILNQDNYNYQNKTSSCICDNINGYYRTSPTYDPLVCTKGTSSDFAMYYIADLDKEIFKPEKWKNSYTLMGENNIQYCEDEKILGYYIPQKQNYFEKTLYLKDIPNFDYLSLDISFNLFFYKTISNYAIKAFIDGQYIWGQFYSVLQPGMSYDDMLLCDSGQTIFYKKFVYFNYTNNDYFRSLVNQNNPTLRIQLFPDSECQLNSNCGMGINNFTLGVSKAMLNKNKVCQYRPFSTCPCSEATQPCQCFPGYFANRLTYGEYQCQACFPNCNECQLATKCNQCLPGYSILNSACVPSQKGLVDTQTSMVRIDISRYYKNILYNFEGYSLNLWVKSNSNLNNLNMEKPLLLVDPFVLSYNSTAVSYILKNTNYNYLFSFSYFFQMLINYPIDKNLQSFYETSWIPISLSFGVITLSERKYINIQMSINGGDTKSANFDDYIIPSQIILFNYYSKVSYKYLKLWDRVISTDILNQMNFIADYKVTPSDLILFYKLIEGDFKNRGSSNLAYVIQGKKFDWAYDNSVGPSTCLENQYYNFTLTTCEYCDSMCTHCYGPGTSSCVECNEPSSFYDKSINSCTEICQQSLIANFKYKSRKTCEASCPSECEKCDNVNGCTQCKNNYLLSNNTCIKYCTPEISKILPRQCYDLSTKCTPLITILNKQKYFLMDGSNLKLKVDVNDCGGLTVIKWVSTFDLNLLEIINEGRILFIDSKYMLIPSKKSFNVFLYDYNQTTILSRDSVEIEFISNTINGGGVVPLYMNETYYFSVQNYDKYITKKFPDKMIKYNWVCPYWVHFDYCNPNIYKPYITIDGNYIQPDLFRYDLLFEIFVDVIMDSEHYDRLYGYMIVYSQQNITKYLQFQVVNATKIGYNLPAKFEINFKNVIDYVALKRDISIKWTINSTNITPDNGDNLPAYIFTPKGNIYGTFELKCTLYYRKDSPVQSVIQNAMTFLINPPPNGGSLSIFPSSGNFLTTNFQLNVFGYTPNVASITRDPNYRYVYYYKNPFNEYMKIEKKMILTDNYSPSIIPPTGSIKMELYYDISSFIEEFKNVTITPIFKFDYLTEIDKIFEFDVADSLLIIEAYALNFRLDDTLSKQTNRSLSDRVCQKFISKLSGIFKATFAAESKLPELFENIQKVGVVLETVTFKTSDSNNITEIFNIFNSSYYIASELFGKTDIFSEPENNNFLRTYNNLLTLIDRNQGKDGILDQIEKILDLSALNVDLGLQRLVHLENLEIVATIVNPNFLKKDVVYSFEKNEPNNLNKITYIKTVSKTDLFTNENLETNNNNIDNNSIIIDVTVPMVFLDMYPNDAVVQVTRLPNFNSYSTDFNELKKSEKLVPLTGDIIDATFINVTRYQATNKNTNVSPNSTKTANRYLQNSDNSTNTTVNTNNETSANSTNTNNTSNSTQITVNKINYTVLNPYMDSSVVIINFKIPEINFTAIYNSTSCLKFNDNNLNEDDEEAICNTWFDYDNNIIQCECDMMGTYTVVYDPNFLYLRRRIQFPQFDDSINQPWGYGTLLVLVGFLFLLVLLAYVKDRKDLNALNNESLKKQYYKEFREKMKDQMMNMKELTFCTLFIHLFKYSNEFYSILFYKDFYFLRAHRVLSSVLKLYVLILFCFYKEHVQMDNNIKQMVATRDIRIKDLRFNIYNWKGDWSTEIVDRIFYALPIGFFLILFPRVSELLFKYKENDLRYLDSTQVLQEMNYIYFNKQIKNCNSLAIEGNGHGNLLKLNLDAVKSIRNNDTNRISNDENLLRTKTKKYRAFINFNRIINVLMFEVRYQLYLNENQDIFPEDLAPIYTKKLQGQIENYENRNYSIKTELHKEIERVKEVGDEKRQRPPEVFKDKKKILTNLGFHFEGKDSNLKELMHRYGYQENIIIGNKAKATSSDNLMDKSSDSIQEKTYAERRAQEKKEQAEREEREKQEKIEKEKREREEKLRKEMELKKVTFKNPSNAFLPYLIERNNKFKKILFLKIGVLFFLIGILIFFITTNFISVRNEGGAEKVLFWLILACMSLIEYYLIFLPILCIFKTILIRTYGTFYPKKLICNCKYVLFSIFVTEVDRALFKELHQCVKNNAHMEQEKQLEFEENNTLVSKLSDELGEVSFHQADHEKDAEMIGKKDNNKKNYRNHRIVDPNNIEIHISEKSIANEISEAGEHIRENEMQQKNRIPDYLEHNDFDFDDSFKYNDNPLDNQ